MDNRSRECITLKTKDIVGASTLLKTKFSNVKVQQDSILVYDVLETEPVVEFLLKNGHVVSEIRKNKIGLEEYYVELMSNKEVI